MSVQTISTAINLIGLIALLVIVGLLALVLVRRPSVHAAVPPTAGGLLLLVVSRFVFVPFTVLSGDPNIGFIAASAVSNALSTAGVALLVFAVYRAAGSRTDTPSSDMSPGSGSGPSPGFVADRTDDEVLANSPLRAAPRDGPRWAPPAGYDRPDAG